MKHDASIGVLLTLSLPTHTFALPSYSQKVIPSEPYIEVGTDNSTHPWRIFKSSTNTPPDLQINRTGESLQDGYIFLTPRGATTQSAGFIVTEDNELVYAIPIAGLTDFRVQNYNNTPHLTYWTGNNAQIGHGYGQVNFADSTLKNFSFNPTLGVVPDQTQFDPIGNGDWDTVEDIDFHESTLTNRDTFLVSAYNNTPFDLTSIGGPADGWIIDSVFYEIDVATQEVLFTWTAADHLDQIPFNSSRNPAIGPESNGTAAFPWDWIHINSVRLVGEDYLISTRHTWSIYLISHVDGSVIWHLDGETGGDFGYLPPEATFRWQHDAQANNVTSTSLDLSVYDNHSSGQAPNDTEIGQSKALVLHLELPLNGTKSASLRRRLLGPEPIYADAMGSYDPDIGNGNQLIGWGQVAATTEYGPDGDVRYHAVFGTPGSVLSYRAYKQVWHATPADWDPSLVVEDGKAFVSWNGATDVEAWNVYTGRSNETLFLVGVAEKKGFETTFAVPGNGTVVQVGAVQGGEEVRRSNVVPL